MTRSVRYQPILHTLYYTLHTEHAYCLSYRFLNNVVITTVIEMVEMVEILDGRLGKRSVERVRYINNLLHLVIVKYGDISLVLCISTRLRLVTILSLLVKYLVIFHADPCNKSYIYMEPRSITLPRSRCACGVTIKHQAYPIGVSISFSMRTLKVTVIGSNSFLFPPFSLLHPFLLIPLLRSSSFLSFSFYLHHCHYFSFTFHSLFWIFCCTFKYQLCKLY